MRAASGAARVVYLDSCCLNRPFDDQSQERVRAETDAVTRILTGVADGRWRWVASDVLIAELQETPDVQKREFLLAMVRGASRLVVAGERHILRAQALGLAGLSRPDAMHVACAEAGGVDAFITVDDVLARRAWRLGRQLTMAVRNPVVWLGEVAHEARGVL